MLFSIQVLVIFVTFLEIIFAQNCNNSYLIKNVIEQKYIYDEAIEYSQRFHIEVVNQIVPQLCEGMFDDFSNVRVMFLVNDQIREIQPDAFRNLSILRYLEIKNNYIKTIKNGVFNHLNVCKNYLNCVLK